MLTLCGSCRGAFTAILKVTLAKNHLLVLLKVKLISIKSKYMEVFDILFRFDNDVYKFCMDLVKKSIAIIFFYGII